MIRETLEWSEHIIAQSKQIVGVWLSFCGWSFKTWNTKYGLKVSLLLKILVPHHPLIGFASFLRQLSSLSRGFWSQAQVWLDLSSVGHATNHLALGAINIFVIFVIINDNELTYRIFGVSIIITVSNISIAISIIRQCKRVVMKMGSSYTFVAATIMANLHHCYHQSHHNASQSVMSEVGSQPGDVGGGGGGGEQASLFLPLSRRNHLLKNSPFSVNL